VPQAKQLQSFKRLRKNLNRGDTLLEKFFDRPGGKARSVGQPKSHEQELLRAVLVLSVGALDAFLSELLVELLPGLARASPDAAVFDRISRENPGLVLRAMYLGGIDEALAEAIEAHFQAKTMHGAKAVRQVSDWCALGLSDAAYNTQRFTGALQTLDEWTDKRHRIVHTGELVKMKRTDASDVIALVESIGRTLNDKAASVYRDALKT
jgi:hypothetical protein